MGCAYEIDGERTTMQALLGVGQPEDERPTREDRERVESMRPGDVIEIGGGAWATFAVACLPGPMERPANATIHLRDWSASEGALRAECGAEGALLWTPQPRLATCAACFAARIERR